MVDRKRHLAKACTYRIFGSSVTAGVTFALTGHVAASVTAGIADTFLKIVLYYVHERIWYRVKWGVRTEAAVEAPPTPRSEVVVRPAGQAVPPRQADLPDQPQPTTAAP